MKRIFRYLTPALIALAAAGIYLGIRSFSTDRSPKQSQKVAPGRDYYISIPLIECSERDGQGRAWDAYNQTGPDIFYEIYWKGHQIFKSTVKQDSFVAKWSNAELDVTKIALDGGKTSLESLIQGARLNIRSQEELEVRIYDSDLVSNELIGTKSFPTTDLLIGDTTYGFSGPGVIRLVLRAADLTALPDVSK